MGRRVANSGGCPLRGWMSGMFLVCSSPSSIAVSRSECSYSDGDSSSPTSEEMASSNASASQKRRRWIPTVKERSLLPWHCCDTKSSKVRPAAAVRLHEELATRSKLHLVMELVRAVTSSPGSPPSRRRVFLQLVSALVYCHERGVSHHDVKPQNVLLNADVNLKVCHFGLAVLPDSLRDDGRQHTACGMPTFTALEMLRRKAYDGAKADAWSCCVILFILLAGALPCHDANIVDMCRRAQRRE